MKYIHYLSIDCMQIYNIVDIFASCLKTLFEERILQSNYGVIEGKFYSNLQCNIRVSSILSNLRGKCKRQLSLDAQNTQVPHSLTTHPTVLRRDFGDTFITFYLGVIRKTGGILWWFTKAFFRYIYQ